MTRWMGWVLALALLGAQAGCDTDRTDSDGDGIHDGADCDPHSRYVWKEVQAYEDVDQDKYGSGEARTVCMGKVLPGGYSLQAGDCAPKESQRWMDLTGKGYYGDEDGDGFHALTPSTACVGSVDLVLYRQAPGTDCDDTNKRLWKTHTAYADVDGDGFGAGELISSCIGETPPPEQGTSATNTDCAPEDPARYRTWSYAGRDEDGDGRYTRAPGTLCIGATTPVGYTELSIPAPDCDDTRADVWSPLEQYADSDGDGVGSGPRQSLCSAGTRPLPGHSTSGGDCAPDDRTRWMTHTYGYRDADGDGARVPQSGQVCAGYALPAGYFTAPNGSADCDDTRADVSILQFLFVDTDGDGVGAGVGQTLCTGPTLPAGYSGSSSDCAPEDGSRWRLNPSPYRDADGDGYTVAAAASVCLGTSSDGYPASSRGPDCDDTRADLFQALAFYVDTDGDGVGAGAPLNACTNGTLPAGHSSQGTDCAPEDAARWKSHTVRFVDVDGDGHTQPTTGQVCAADALPAPYVATASGNDCDDADPTRFLWRVLYPDRDGDGVGAPPRVVMCLNATGLPPGHSIYGYDTDDTNPTRSQPPEDFEFEEAVLSP